MNRYSELSILAYIATIFLITNLCQGAVIPKKISTTLVEWNSRITNGQNAVQGVYPYQVSLWWGYPPSYESSHFCGGAIIANEWILTAAHCFTDLPDYGTVTVYAGKHNINNVETNQQSSAVRQYIIHPDYKGGENPDDIALVRLTTAFRFTSYVAPIALPNQNFLHSGNVVVTGWGSISLNDTIVLPTILQTATVPIITNNACYDALYKLIGATTIDDTNICTGPLDNSRISFCAGDSGGPLAQSTNNVWQLVGIVSWGIYPCGASGIPSVYVRVSYYTNWITSQISSYGVVDNA